MFRTGPKNRRLIYFILLIGLLIPLFLLGYKNGVKLLSKSIKDTQEYDQMSLLWDQGEYQQLMDLTEQELLKNPLSEDALFLKGASLFYYAISRSSTESRIENLNQSIFSLRKLLTLNAYKYETQCYYLLGKAYLEKGSYYADNAIYYLQLAIDNHYINTDSYEYLAEAYSLIGNYQQSLYYLEEVLKYNPNDKVQVKIAENSYSNGDYQRAEEFYLKALESSQDEIMKEEILFSLSVLYFNLKNYSQAKKVLSQYLEIDYNNRDAHFMLGESFYYLGDMSSARAEWHRAERIDPYYRPVLVRLYN